MSAFINPLLLKRNTQAGHFTVKLERTSSLSTNTYL